MTKKCIDCHTPAEFRIKDTSEFYCRECAEEHFADISLLIKIEEAAQKLKKYLEVNLDNDVKQPEENHG